VRKAFLTGCTVAALSCAAVAQTPPACDELCAAQSEKTNPYLRLTPEKLFEQARSLDRRMAAGRQPDKAEFMDIFVALGRLATSNPEAKQLQDSLEERNRRAAKQSLAEIKDERARRQLQAIDEISECTGDKYKNHHSERGRRVMAQTPPEDRTETFMKYIEILAMADQGDKDLGEVYANLDRLAMAERFTRELKAARPGTGDVSGIVARYCTGRGEPRIGMTQLEVEQDTTWCVPAAINETITAGHSRQQAVFYGDRLGSGGNTGYLYFEDGKLVAIQRRN
jgi:hypothetical protein